MILRACFYQGVSPLTPNLFKSFNITNLSLSDSKETLWRSRDSEMVNALDLVWCIALATHDM